VEKRWPELANGGACSDLGKKPFAGLNDSQIQFHTSSLSSLPFVKITEENEGNEE